MNSTRTMFKTTLFLLLLTPLCFSSSLATTDNITNASFFITDRHLHSIPGTLNECYGNVDCLSKALNVFYTTKNSSYIIWWPTKFAIDEKWPFVLFPNQTVIMGLGSGGSSCPMIPVYSCYSDMECISKSENMRNLPCVRYVGWYPSGLIF